LTLLVVLYCCVVHGIDRRACCGCTVQPDAHVGDTAMAFVLVCSCCLG
jgi:hypothetical protein